MKDTTQHRNVQTENALEIEPDSKQALSGRECKGLTARKQLGISGQEPAQALEFEEKKDVDQKEDEWWCPNEDCRLLVPDDE